MPTWPSNSPASTSNRGSSPNICSVGTPAGRPSSPIAEKVTLRWGASSAPPIAVVTCTFPAAVAVRRPPNRPTPRRPVSRLSTASALPPAGTVSVAGLTDATATSDRKVRVTGVVPLLV